MIPQNDYEIRQLTVEDRDQFIKLTADAYFNDSGIQTALDLSYDDCKVLAFAIDYDHIMKTGFNYGAFYDDQLVGTMVSFDWSNVGNPKGFDDHEKLRKLSDLRKQCTTEFLRQKFQPGEWIQVRFIQTHPDHRGRKIQRLLLEKCYQKWIEHKFKYVFLWATHVASKKLLFGLSREQYVYAKAEKLNDNPFYFEALGVKLKYDQSDD